MCQDLAAERTPTMLKKALESMPSTAASMPRPNLKSKVSMPSTAELAATSAECRLADTLAATTATVRALKPAASVRRSKMLSHMPSEESVSDVAPLQLKPEPKPKRKGKGKGRGTGKTAADVESTATAADDKMDSLAPESKKRTKSDKGDKAKSEKGDSAEPPIKKKRGGAAAAKAATVPVVQSKLVFPKFGSAAAAAAEAEVSTD